MTEPATEPTLEQQIIAATRTYIAARRARDAEAAATALAEIDRLEALRNA